jgi:hypothetical protein
MPMPPLPDALSRAATGPIYVILTHTEFLGEMQTLGMATVDRGEAALMLHYRMAEGASICLLAGLNQATVDITATFLRPHAKPATPNGDPA